MSTWPTCSHTDVCKHWTCFPTKYAINKTKLKLNQYSLNYIYNIYHLELCSFSTCYFFFSVRLFTLCVISFPTLSVNSSSPFRIFIPLQLLDPCSFVPLLMIELHKILHLTRIEFKKTSNATHWIAFMGTFVKSFRTISYESTNTSDAFVDHRVIP